MSFDSSLSKLKLVASSFGDVFRKTPKTTQSDESKKRSRKRIKRVQAREKLDQTSTTTDEISTNLFSRSSIFNIQGSPTRQVYPLKEVTVFYEQAPTKKRAKRADEESFGSWHKGPVYRHLLPAYKPTKKLFWSTTEIAKKFPRCEESIQMSLSELIVNSMFIFCLLMVAFAMEPEQRFHYQNFLRKSLLNFDIPYWQLDRWNVKRFDVITEQHHMFKYIEHCMIKNSFMDYYYERDEITRVVPAVLGTYYILGVPRIHQWRMPTNTCIIADPVSMLIEDCYSDYNYFLSDKEPILAQNMEDFLNDDFISFYKKSDWVYQKPKGFSMSLKHLKSYISTEMNNYPNVGHAFTLERGKDLEKNNTLLLKAQHALGWIRRETRAIIVEFPVYNPNVNLMATIKIIFEYLPSGGVWPTLQVKTVKMFHLVSKEDYFIFGFVTATGAYLILQIVEEAREIVFFKFMYFFRFWSWVDMIVIAAQIYGFYNLFYVMMFVRGSMDYFRKWPNKYLDLDAIVYHDFVYDNCIIIITFFAIYKIFRYIDYYGNVDIFTRVIANGGYPLLFFTCRFGLIFFSYAQLGFFLFGSYIEDYSTVLRSLMTLLQMYYGYFDYKKLTRLQPIIGGLFFVGIIFILVAMCSAFFVVVFYNFFSIYESVIIINKGTTAFGMCTVLCRKAFYWVYRRYKKPVLPEHNITYAECIEALDILRFTRPETDMLVRRYKIHPENTLDPVEVSLMIEKLREEIKHSIKKRERRRHMMVSRVHKGCSEKPLSYQQWMRMNDVMDRLEITSQTAHERVFRMDHLIHRAARVHNFKLPETPPLPSVKSSSDFNPPPPAADIFKKKPSQ